jgi:hypothetical protein
VVLQGVWKDEWKKIRRQGASHPKQHQRSQKCLRTSPEERGNFDQKKRQGNSTKRLQSRLSDIGVFRPLVKPEAPEWHKTTVRTTSGYMSSQERGTINQQKPSAGEIERTFWRTLDKGSGLEQPTHPVELRYDGVDIDLLIRKKIEGALKYLKNNKAAGANSIADELLKNGGPDLVDALHEVIQQAWTS